MGKGVFFLLICFSLIRPSWASADEKSASRKPSFKYKDYNVIFVSFDALQAKHVQMLGNERNITPAIDAMARKGFCFRNIFSVASWTVPSSMSWFTGVFPSEHKVVNKFSIYNSLVKKISNLNELSPDLVTLAEIFKNNGYATAGFTGDAGVKGVFGFSRGFDVYVDDRKFGGMDHSIPKAVEWLNKNKEKKFFMFLHGYDCHGQFEPSAGFDYRFVDKTYDHKYKGTNEEQEALREEGLANGKVNVREQDVQFWRAVYDEKINRSDSLFGAFLKELDKLDLTRKTILVLTSDHGTELFEHQRIDHGFTLYDELIHVPLIIVVPDQSAGRMIDDQVSSIDVMPTILDLMSLDLPENVTRQLKGRSLLPQMKGVPGSRDVYAETDYRQYTYKRMVRTVDGWKFIYTLENKNRELYDLNNDPKELLNLVDREKRKAYELEQRLFDHLKSFGSDPDKRWETGCNPVYDSQAPDYKKP
ncbi:MAG: sulfatase [Candidatus Omnitrophota bacterium]